MPPHERTPIEEQAAWRVVAGLAVGMVFACLCFVVPVYVVLHAQGGNPLLWGLFALIFWCGGGLFLLGCGRGLRELLARRTRQPPR